MQINIIEDKVTIEIIEDNSTMDSVDSSLVEVIEIVDIGPQGPPGAAVNSYNFTQPTPALVWNINHNLGFKPSMDCFSSGGLPIEGSVLNLNNNQLTVTWNSPVEGSARLN